MMINNNDDDNERKKRISVWIRFHFIFLDHHHHGSFQGEIVTCHSFEKKVDILHFHFFLLPFFDDDEQKLMSNDKPFIYMTLNNKKYYMNLWVKEKKRNTSPSSSLKH